MFLFDDAYAIVDNVSIRTPAALWALLATERPVVELSLAINYAFGGLDPFGYHLFNLVVHLVAGLTLFGLVRKTIALKQSCGREPADTAHVTELAPGALFALVVALIWLVHPLQTQSVTYVIQRGESMMGLFYLLTLYFFVRAVDSPRPLRWYAGSILACALAMSSKAVAVTAPVLVVLYDYLFVERSLRNIARHRWGYYVVLCSTWGVLAACGVFQHIFTPATDRTAVGLGFKGISPWEYALTQPGVILHYLRLSFLPYPLCLDYAWPVAKTAGLMVWPLVLMVIPVLLTLWAVHRRHWLGFVGAWFFVILAPTSSVIPVRDLAVEHRMYLPLGAVIVAALAIAAAGFRALANRWKLEERTRYQFAVSTLFLVVVALGVGTIRRNRDYDDDLGMWRDVAAKRPDNARAWINIGVLSERREDPAGAVEAYRKALRIAPEYPDGHYNLGVALIRLKRNGDAEVAFQSAINLAPDYLPAHVNLGALLSLRGDLEGAAAEYRAALSIAPRNADVRGRLAQVLARLGRGDEAREEFLRTIELNPRDVSAHVSFGDLLRALGESEEAAKQYRQALTLDPHHRGAAKALNQLPSASP
ncbi:MAG: tetratricopeptide repeat protein [Phycisphaerales bacterium]|nr:tetratricopeptide repeat protein [Phycisphaerales bacterium]